MKNVNGKKFALGNRIMNNLNGLLRYATLRLLPSFRLLARLHLSVQAPYASRRKPQKLNVCNRVVSNEHKEVR